MKKERRKIKKIDKEKGSKRKNNEKGGRDVVEDRNKKKKR